MRDMLPAVLISELVNPPPVWRAKSKDAGNSRRRRGVYAF